MALEESEEMQTNLLQWLATDQYVENRPRWIRRIASIFLQPSHPLKCLTIIMQTEKSAKESEGVRHLRLGE